MPQLVEAGLIYKAVPPLYKIMEGKNKVKYIVDNNEYATYMQEQIAKNIEVFQGDGKTRLGRKDIISLIVRNSHYVRDITKLSRRFVCNPMLLELIARNYDMITRGKLEKFKKVIDKNYDFLTVDLKKKELKGTLDKEYQYIRLDEGSLRKVREIADHLRKEEDIYYKVDGNKLSLYQLLKLFQSFEPSNKQRYKGETLPLTEVTL